MSKYGDILLKAMTADVLAELLGPSNLKEIGRITPFAVSNAFYEQIVFYYDLDLWPSEISTTVLQRKRGDILEAYIAAIEKDVSRAGQGYREAREWLLKVLAFRLRRSLLREDLLEEGSIALAHRSLRELLSIPPTESSEVRAKLSVTSSGVSINTPKAGLSQLGGMWFATSSENPASGSESLVLQRALTFNSTSDPVSRFRQIIFEDTRQIFQRTQRTSPSEPQSIRAFWIALLDYFDHLDLQNFILDENLHMLLLYYRVSSALGKLTL